MNDWRDLIIRHLGSFEGVAVVTTLVLLGFAVFVLPRDERRELKFPTFLIGGYAIVELIHRSLPTYHASKSTLARLGLLLLLIALTRVGFLVVVDWLLGKRLGRPLPRIFRDILQALLFVAMALVLFRSMGVELGSLLTTSAILTAVIGLSLQESLGNLVAGLAVRAEHPFEIGDWVDIGEGRRMVGRVIEINWRATKLRTNDLVDIVVPNGLIAKSTIQNFSRPSSVTRRTVAFQGPYEISPAQIKQAVIPALEGCSGISPNPAPRLWVDRFADCGIDYQVVYFLADFGGRSDVDSEIRSRIWYAMNRAGISFPYPVRDVRTSPPAPGVLESAEWNVDRRVGILEGIPLFDAMPEPIRRQIAEAMGFVLYAEGETIIREGEIGHDLFVVADGDVTVITHTATKERITLAGLSRGDVFGELSLVTGVRGATVLAAKESKLLRLSHDDFRRIVSQEPGLGEMLLTRVVERQDQLGRPENLGLDPATPNAAVRGALFEKIRRFFAV
jgi:small-conductance mechanosensitive channel/CRP-like cAMP-binding protein